MNRFKKTKRGSDLMDKGDNLDPKQLVLPSLLTTPLGRE